MSVVRERIGVHRGRGEVTQSERASLDVAGHSEDAGGDSPVDGFYVLQPAQGLLHGRDWERRRAKCTIEVRERHVPPVAVPPAVLVAEGLDEVHPGVGHLVQVHPRHSATTTAHRRVSWRRSSDSREAASDSVQRSPGGSGLKELIDRRNRHLAEPTDVDGADLAGGDELVELATPRACLVASVLNELVHVPQPRLTNWKAGAVRLCLV